MSGSAGKDDRTPEQIASAKLIYEICSKREHGESWDSIATWLKTTL